MAVTKFDLYRTEWLDLVFTNRNKNYGAYELRQSYASTMIKAMSITFFTLGAIIAAYTAFAKPVVRPETGTTITCFDDETRIIDIELVKPKPPKKTTAPPVKATPPKLPPPEKVKTTVIPVKVSSDPAKIIEPTKNVDIKTAIGSVNSDKGTGADNGPATSEAEHGGKGIESGGGGGTSNEPVDYKGVMEVMPEPVGGKQAWAKFLQKHLRYPAAAEEQGINGRVSLSFIIEKDGRLTDIRVESGAGFGFDDEALRVLKLAPAWKPGIQNGRPVRVKYTIPINFRAPE